MSLHRQIRELVIRESEVEYLARRRRGIRRQRVPLASYGLLFLVLLGLALWLF